MGRLDQASLRISPFKLDTASSPYRADQRRQLLAKKAKESRIPGQFRKSSGSEFGRVNRQKAAQIYIAFDKHRVNVLLPQLKGRITVWSISKIFYLTLNRS